MKKDTKQIIRQPLTCGERRTMDTKQSAGKPLSPVACSAFWDAWLTFLDRTKPDRADEDALFSTWRDGWLARHRSLVPKLEMGEWQRLRRIENAANWCVGWLSAGDLPDDVAMLTRLKEALEDNADLTGNQKLGKRCRISEKIRKACRCIGLLNSMVRGGERHSDTSSRMVVEALDALDYLEQHNPTADRRATEKEKTNE